MEIKCIANSLNYSEMSNSCKEYDPTLSSLIYNNENQYLMNMHQRSSTSHSDRSDEMSFHSKDKDSSPTNYLHLPNSEYFCDNAVFDNPKLVGPPALYEDANDYEEFSHLIKLSLEDTNSYLTNDMCLQETDYYSQNVAKLQEKSNSLQYNNDTYSLLNSSQSCPEVASDRQNILSEAVEYLTMTTSLQNNYLISQNQPQKLQINHKSDHMIMDNSISPNSTIVISNAIKYLTNPTQDYNLLSQKNQPSTNCMQMQNIQEMHQKSNEIHQQPGKIINETNQNSAQKNVVNQSSSQELNQKCSDIELIPKEKTPTKVVQQCTPSKTYINAVNPNLSPELFSEDDDSNCDTSTDSVANPATQNQNAFYCNELLIGNDRKLLKRLHETLSGVPPPPSVTIMQMTVTDMLGKINKTLLFPNELSLNNSLNTSTDIISEKKMEKSLLINNTKKDIDDASWPNIMNCRYHGVYYNRSKVSEDFEHYCTKYAARYVGVETASSCTVWSTMAPSSATKRRNAKLRWGIKSPGRRLSHLARRRITFSSSNLQQASATMSVAGTSSGSRQIMIDTRRNSSMYKRKSPRKSPWKRSPQKRIKTPNKSATKTGRRLVSGSDDVFASTTTTKASGTKRALFRSPEQTRSTADSSSPNLQKLKPKRALFLSPVKNPTATKTSVNCDRKRKRGEEDCHPSKFPRSLSFDVHHSNVLNAAASGTCMTRRNSEIILRPSATKGELSDLHRKKLLWAVSEALRSHQISMSHPQFRTYASVLCKVVKQLMPDLISNGPRQPGSTSDRMLKIAHQTCFSVIRGKPYEQIIEDVKTAEANQKNLKPATGYVGPDSHPKNVLQDKVMNVESNKRVKSPIESNKVIDDCAKLRNIRRQILFDDAEITKTCNTNR